MCRSKMEGGQRCYAHALQAWQVAQRRVARQADRLGAAQEAAKSDPDDQEAWRMIGRAKELHAQSEQVARGHLVEMASTAEGGRNLAKRISEEEDPEEKKKWEVIYNEGQALRQANTDRGRANAAARLVVGVNGARYGLDEEQTEAVWRRTLASVRGREGDQEYADPKKWESFVQAEHDALDTDEHLTNTQFDRARRNLRTAAGTPPTRHVANAAHEFRDRAERAAAALDRQVDLGAGMRGVSHEQYRERVAAFRKQYQETPAERRPAPPADWVQGVTQKDRQARSMPDDPATQWAHYRAQADPDAFPDADRSFVSVDIETAGPPGRAGFEPEHGQIIEVGMVAYNSHGVEVGSYATLVKPRKADYGTGATHIHHITEDDVKDAPTWAQVAPQVAARTRGRVMLAQNSPFEDRWLGYGMGQEGQEWQPRATLDTLRIAQQHHGNEERHTLDRICARVGVPSGEDGQGHRAEHDARVAAKAWFKMREQLESTYQADPKRRSLPQPQQLALKARPGKHQAAKKAAPVTRPRPRTTRPAGAARSGRAQHEAEEVGAGGGGQHCPSCGQFAGASHVCPHQDDRGKATMSVNATPTTSSTDAAPGAPQASTSPPGVATAHGEAETGRAVLTLDAARNEFEGLRKVVDVPLADYAPEPVRDRLRSAEFQSLLERERTTREQWETAEQAREDGTCTAPEYHRALDEHRAAQANLLAYREDTARLLVGAPTTAREADFALPVGVHRLGEAEPGSAAWLRMRQDTVGGSDVGAIAKVGRWGDLNYRDVRAAKLDLDPQDQPHEGASWVGDVWEPHLASCAAEALGEAVYTNKGTYSDGTRHVNLDAFTKNTDGGVGTVVEIKTSSKPADWETSAPGGFVLQTQHYMDMTGASRGLIVANVNDERLVMYRVEATDKVKAGPRTNKGMGEEFSYAEVRPHAEKLVKKWGEEREAARVAAGGTQARTRRRYELTDEEKATWRDALDNGYVIVDLETTHTSARRGHVIEFAGTDDQGRQFTALYDVPDAHAAWNGTGATEVHGIDRSMLKGRPILHEDKTEQARLREFIGDRVVVAHHAQFEHDWLAEAGVPVRTADTQRAFGALVSDEHIPDNTMGSLTAWAGVKYENAHRAAPDVRMLGEALKSLRPLLDEATRNSSRDTLKDAS